MAEAPVRIALLARAGEAREQLRRALLELGAELVAEGDPAEIDPVQLQALAPKVVMISLEPATEDVLDRFEATLAAPDVEVMFDDAEVTRQLQGWDLARWARHLASKLVGGNLLPPAPVGAAALEQTEFTPVPGAPPTPAQLMDDARLEDYTADASDLALDVPSTPSLADVALPDDGLQLPNDMTLEEASLEVDLSMLEQAMNAAPPEPELPSSPSIDDPGAAGLLDVDAELPTRSFGEMAPAEEEIDFSLDIDLAGLERSLAEGSQSAPATAAPEELDNSSGLLIDVDFDNDAPVNFAAFSAGDDLAPVGLDADVAALAAQLDAQRPEPTDGLPELDFSLDAAAAEPSLASPSRSFEAALPELESAPGLQLPDLDFAALGPAAPAPASQGLELSLMDETPASPPAAVASRAIEPPAAKPTGSMFAGMSLSLEGDAPVPTPEVSAVMVVLAGLGGPDAVRRLLAALPASLPVPVLLFQHLDNGKYDRLADQMAKGSPLPVTLAKQGEWLQPGQLAVLAPGIGMVADGQGYRFCAGELSDLINQLPEGSAAVVLSGADAGLAPDLIVRRRHGVALYAQTPDSCFDDTAARAAIAGGASEAAPAELAAQLAGRWKR